MAFGARCTWTSCNQTFLLNCTAANSTGAAAFFAMREYEKHQDANGQPPSHQFAKELMAGVAGAEVGCCHQHIFLQCIVLLLMIHLAAAIAV